MFKIGFMLLTVASASVLGYDFDIGFRMTERLSMENPIYESRITCGENAVEGEFPYQTSLKVNGRHICGGVIISETKVLTAAHCVYGKKNYTAYEMVAGFISQKNPGSNIQRNPFKSVVIYSSYPGSVGPGDIAVVTVEKTFKWTQYVQKAFLPKKREEFTGDTMLSGWGSTSRTQQPVMPDILQKAKLPLVSYEECVKYFSSPPLDKASNICTGPINGNLSACSGDSGGPLVKIQQGKVYVIGLVSWGRIPCGRGAPTVYTKVSNFIDFINNSA